ncbi:MAG TPA: glycine cleavage system protein GcvH [Phycisphaerae bacterium]|nr:glycine cleavage system protein GcvH [Phycisphaerae bacterium]
MAVPSDRRYLKSHEWHKLEGDTVTIGITKFAADELTDITFVSLPAVGKAVTAGKSFGEIESVKATSDLMSGVSGTVTAVNTKLGESPELVNNDAFDGGWMVKVKVSDPGQLNSLMSAEQYEAQLGS